VVHPAKGVGSGLRLLLGGDLGMLAIEHNQCLLAEMVKSPSDRG
jgi:hypothetical protein